MELEAVNYYVRRDPKTKRYDLFVTYWTGHKHVIKKHNASLAPSEKKPSVRDFYPTGTEPPLPYFDSKFELSEYASRIFEVPREWMPINVHSSLNSILWSKSRLAQKNNKQHFVSSNEDFIRRYVSIDYRNRARYEFGKTCSPFDPSVHGFVLVSQKEPFDEWRYALIRVLLSSDVEDLRNKHVRVIKDSDADLRKTICHRMFYLEEPRNLFRVLSAISSGLVEKRANVSSSRKSTTGRVNNNNNKRHHRQTRCRWYFKRIRKLIFGSGQKTLTKRRLQQLGFFGNGGKQTIVYLDRDALKRVSSHDEGISMWDFESFYPSIATRYNRDKRLAEIFGHMISFRRSNEVDGKVIKEIMVRAVGQAANRQEPLDLSFHEFIRHESVAVITDLVTTNSSRTLGVCTDGILMRGSASPINVPSDLRLKREFYTERYAFHSINLYCCWAVPPPEEEMMTREAASGFIIKGLPGYNKNRPEFVKDALEKLAGIVIGAPAEKLKEICQSVIDARDWRLTDLILTAKPTSQKWKACDYFRNNLSPYDKPLVYTKDETAVSTAKDSGWPFADQHACLLDAKLCKSYDLDRYVKAWYDPVTVLLKVLFDFNDPPTYQWWNDVLKPKLQTLCGPVVSQLPGITCGNGGLRVTK